MRITLRDSPRPHQASHRSTRLIAAVESGDPQEIKVVLDKGAPVNAEDQRGWTALTTAAQEGQSGIIELLISKGARIDAKDDFAVGRTALMRASALGRTNIVETLLAHNADTRIEREDGSNALTDGLPYPAIVARLMAAGADGNEQLRPDWSPLIAACSEGYAESAGILIQHGADLNRDGPAALDAASRSGSAEAIAVLLAKGLRVSRKILGQCLSSAYCHPQAMRELLAAGADPNARCTCAGGRTPLMISALNGCPETVDLLIKAGADLNAKDDNGHTALDLMLADKRTGWMDSTSTEKPRLSAIVDALCKSGAKETGLFVEWREPR